MLHGAAKKKKKNKANENLRNSTISGMNDLHKEIFIGKYKKLNDLDRL